MTKHYISACIELRDGADLEKAEKGLRLLAEQTQSEPGCLLFEIRQNLQEPHKFTLWECWTDRKALSDHFEMEHTKAYLAQDLTQVNYIEELGEIGMHADEQAA
ncbi:MAG: antibiotic biosynthesis monooxygenase [Pseudomonadota bacterium]